MRMTDQKKLVEFFARVVRSLDSPPFVFTDGLDECSRWSWTRLSEYLKTLSREAAKPRPTYNKEREMALSLCVKSRTGTEPIAGGQEAWSCQHICRGEGRCPVDEDDLDLVMMSVFDGRCESKRTSLL
jgi:hypothetical protein